MPFTARPTTRWRQRVASSQGRTLLAAALLFLLLLVIVWQNLRLEYRGEADAILGEANRSAQKLAARTTEVLNRVSQTTQLVKRLRETDNPASLQSLRDGGVLAQDVTQALLVSDARGFVVEATTAELPLNISDDDHFKRLRALPADGIDLGAVEPQPALGTMAMTVSRRLDAPGGGFGGIVSALVSPATLVAGHSDSEQPGTAISLAGLDGVLRARLLNGHISHGERVDIHQLIERSHQVRASGRPLRSLIDGVPRFFVTVPVEGYPLLAMVARDAEEALAGYRSRRDRLLLWAAGIGLLLMAGTASLLVQARRLDLSRMRQQEAESGLRATLEGSLDSVLIMRAVRDDEGRLQDLRIIDANARAVSLIGRGGEIVGQLLCALVPSLREEGHLERFERVIVTRTSGAAEVQATDPRLAGRWLHHQVVAVEDGIALITRDVTEQREHADALLRHQQELAALARHDSLTGLPNRRHFDERLAESLVRAQRSRHPPALLFLDLDGFKKVNDELGHEAGDRLLVEVARRLRMAVRASDLVSRLGGDEFTVLLEDAEAGVADHLCERLVEALSLPHALGGRAVLATPSIGLALGRADESADSLLRRADDAMYLAKRSGKGCYVRAA